MSGEERVERRDPEREGTLQSRRDFLLSLKKWSKAVVGGVLVGSALSREGGEAQAGTLVGPRGSWVNRRGGAGWANRRGGGGWVNRAGVGAWANGGRTWANGGAVWANSGGNWINNGGSWVNGNTGWVNTSGGGWLNRR